MNIKAFQKQFDKLYPPDKIGKVTWTYQITVIRKILDTSPSITGMASTKKLRLLHLAYSFLEPNESYLEIGTYTGKSLISAVVLNEPRPTYACDNFSEFNDNSSENILLANLEKYGVQKDVNFF
ncbi:MAG: hypothetical protein V1715_11565 [bacterium]